MNNQELLSINIKKTVTIQNLISHANSSLNLNLCLIQVMAMKLWSFQMGDTKLESALPKNLHTVFPHRVSAETILFLIWKSKGHST